MAAVRSASMVGRDDELAALRELSVGACAGRPAVVAVLGEAGIGKTRLVDELTRELAGGSVLVARGHCVPGAARGLPLASIRGVVEDLARCLGSRLDRLSGSADMVSLLAAAVDPAAATPVGSQPELFEGVARLLRDVARACRLVVVVEDVHWADATSRDLLEYVGRSLRDEQLLLLVTARTGDPDYESCRSFVAGLTALRHGHRLQLRRLTDAQVGEQVAGLRGRRERAPTDLARIVAVSEGVPLLVEEVIDADLDDLGSLADALVGHRVARMQAPARTVVETAAVAVLESTPHQLACATPLPTEEFDAAFAQAVDGGVLVRHHGRVGFRHALLREATLARLLPNAETAMHAAWSRVVGPHPSDHATTVAAAYHRREAGDAAGALEAYVAAARMARAVSAYTEEAQMMKLAADLWPAVPDAAERTGTTLSDVYSAAAWAVHQTLSDVEEGQRLVDLAIAALPSDASAHDRAMATLLWHRLRVKDDRGLSVREVFATVDNVVMDPPSEDAVLACLEAADAAQQGGDPLRAEDYARRAVEAAEAIGDQALTARSLASLGTARGGCGDYAGAVPLARQAVERAERSGDLFARIGALVHLEVIRWQAGEDTADVDSRLVELLGGDRPGPLRGHWGMAQCNHAESLIDTGDWLEAQRLLDIVLAEDLPDFVFWSGRRLFDHLSVLRGDGFPERTSDLPASPRRETLDNTRLDDLLASHYTYADIAARLGDLPGARTHTLRLLGDDRIVANRGYLYQFLMVAARVEADLARSGADPAPEDGRWVAERIRHLLRLAPPVNARDHAYVAHTQADLEHRTGTDTPATWDAVVTAWRKTPRPLCLGTALVRAGEAHRAAGQGHEAAAALRESVRIGRELGARPLIEDALTIGRRAHLRISDDVPNPASAVGLTPRELDVLRLVADGASNSTIARALFISPKTVSVHVSNILAKMEVSSRGEAAAIAHRVGLIAAGEHRR